MKPTILVIDAIHDFVHGKFGSERARGILLPFKKLLCKGPKIRACLIRLCHTTRLYNRICCN